jgi:hypothetical protein
MIEIETTAAIINKTIEKINSDIKFLPFYNLYSVMKKKRPLQNSNDLAKSHLVIVNTEVFLS